MLSKKLLLAFSFILLLNAVSAEVVVTHEDSTVSRIVGDTPSDLANAFDRTEINLTHATFYSSPVPHPLADTPAYRKEMVLKQVFSSAYAAPPAARWSWSDLQSEMGNWQTNEFFALETTGKFENGELVVEPFTEEKLFPSRTGWESAFKEHNPLFLSDSDFSGLYLPKSFDNESFVGQLGQDSLMIAPTAVPDSEFSLAFICAMASSAATQRESSKFEFIWKIYNEARNNYYKYADLPSGKALMSYELYAMPYTKISIPNEVSESNLQARCERYVEKPPALGPLGETKRLVNQVSVGSIQALDSSAYTKEFTVDSSDYNTVSDGNLSWLHLPENQLHKELFKLALPQKIYSSKFPLGTVIKNIELVSLGDPIDLTIENLPMWDNGLVERECYDNNYLAGISFSPVLSTEDSALLFVAINPVQVIDCNTGQLRLYQTIKYNVDYVPSSPVLIDTVNVKTEVTPKELVDVNVSLKNTTSNPANGTIAIVDDKNNVVAQQSISTTPTQFTLRFNAPNEETVKAYELRFIQNNEIKTFKKFYFTVSALEARLEIPETNSGNTTIQVELKNKTSNSMDILLNYYLIKDNNILQSGSIKQKINSGVNSIPISFTGLTKENRSYETEVDLNYSVIASSNKKILFGSITTNHPPALNHIADITVRERETITITPHATDLEGDPIAYSISDPIGNDGIWETRIGDKGNYTITVTASDDLLSDSQNVNITVLNANRAPTIDEYSPTERELTITAGSSQLFSISASDPDNDPLTITWYLNGNQANDSEKYLFNANDFPTGTYNLNVIVSDGELNSSLEWLIEKPEPPHQSCTDSDNGVDPWVFGTCTDNRGTFTDGSLRSNGSGPVPSGAYVLEAFCLTDEMRAHCALENGPAYCNALPNECYAAPLLPSSGLAWTYFDRNDTAYVCQNGSTNGVCNPCMQDWKCSDETHKGYQNQKCQWNSIEECPNGCLYGECKPKAPQGFCVDSDNGVDPWVFGTCTDSRGATVSDQSLLANGSNEGGRVRNGAYVSEAFCLTEEMRQHCTQFNGIEYCYNLPNACYAASLLPSSGLAWTYFDRNDEAYVCPKGSYAGVCIPCTVGWKCKDSGHKAFQNERCQWSQITDCANGCLEGECVAGAAPSNGSIANNAAIDDNTVINNNASIDGNALTDCNALTDENTNR